MYCVWRIPAHLRCTQCSILLHLMDICFLTYIWQISQIQTPLFIVVGPGLVSTSPASVSSSASSLVGPKNGKSGRFDTNCTAACVRCDSSTACRLCRLDPATPARPHRPRNRPHQLYPLFRLPNRCVCMCWILQHLLGPIVPEIAPTNSIPCSAYRTDQ